MHKITDISIVILSIDILIAVYYNTLISKCKQLQPNNSVSQTLDRILKRKVAVEYVNLGRCFDFLRDYYEIQHGAKEFQGNRHTGSLVGPNKSESLTFDLFVSRVNTLKK